MQNNQPNKFTKFWKEKGYYILLSVCIVAVGVSGYFFVTGALEENQAVDESLSVPLTVEEPVEKELTPSKPAEPSNPTAETAEEASAETQLEETAAPVEEPETVMPVSGSVLQNYAMDHLAYNATTQDWRVHNGVDLAAPLGQEVKAAKAGQVTAVYTDEYLGTTVVVQHDGGYTSHYCNLAETTLVAAGDTVAAGQVLGAVGATALIEVAEEPHLHFEVYCNGEPVDPAGFLY